MSGKGGAHVDIEINKRVRRELNRRQVDCSRVQVSIAYGTIFLTGEIKRPRWVPGTLKEEMEIIRNILLHIQGVREVVDHQLRLVED